MRHSPLRSAPVVVEREWRVGSGLLKNVEREIEALRELERRYQAGNEDLDRVQRGLVAAHPGNLVILVGLPPGSWAPLPAGWQTKTQLALTPQWPPIPLEIRGPVAVSIELAREMTK